ncbi:MAG: inositol monophosphatase [Saprospirales bacterium]|nr:MAG: inositol monophosphatase [Saprospirales bacterium]
MTLPDLPVSFEFDLIGIASEVGEWIKNQQRQLELEDVQLKGHNDLVSYVDKTAESMLTERLHQLLPAGFLTEEDVTEDSNDDLVWVIDPLDGTTNFIHGLPIYSVSIALKYQSEYLAGVVSLPTTNENFSAIKGMGAKLNGKSISVSKQHKLKGALIATGFPYHDFGQLDEYLDLLKKFILSTRGVRRMGSAAIDLAYTAAGHFDGFYEYGLNEWDIAAGSLILQEAGGTVSSWKNDDKFVSQKTILASNSLIHAECLGLIQSVFD